MFFGEDAMEKGQTLVLTQCRVRSQVVSQVEALEAKVSSRVRKPGQVTRDSDPLPQSRSDRGVRSGVAGRTDKNNMRY